MRSNRSIENTIVFENRSSADTLYVGSGGLQFRSFEWPGTHGNQKGIALSKVTETCT